MSVRQGVSLEALRHKPFETIILQLINNLKYIKINSINEKQENNPLEL